MSLGFLSKIHDIEKLYVLKRQHTHIDTELEPTTDNNIITGCFTFFVMSKDESDIPIALMLT